MSESQAALPHMASAYSNNMTARYPYGSQFYNNANGQGKYERATGYNQLADAFAGFGLQGHASLTQLKQDAVSGTPASAESGLSRAGYGNTPLMVLPNGQAVPMSAMYAQQPQSAGLNQSMQFPPTGVMPQFLGSNNLMHPGAQAYGYPYGSANDDSIRRGSWSSNEENIPISNGLVNPQQADFYTMDRTNMGSFPYMAAPVTVAQYIAGPIQPMKCADNKSYEMVNLDELTSQDPPIPRAVPALWTNQDDLSLAKCLQNPEGITNIYIRGFMPDTTDDDLHRWSSRFGEIESCKAIIDMETNKCKGFGFVMYFSPASAENCIRGFFHLGFQASYAQKSRNSRLKDLEDRASTNIYCTGVPVEWNEADLSKHFLPYHAVSTKICRDAPSGVSKEVGFARFENREIAERVVRDFHSITAEIDGIKLQLRFADTKAQKQLKQESQKRRSWRSHEYAYSVEHTPSPTVGRLQNIGGHLSPNSHLSYQSPADASTNFTPATSVSPQEAQGLNKVSITTRSNAWPLHGGLQSVGNTPSYRGHTPTVSIQTFSDVPAARPIAAIPIKADLKAKTPSPQKCIKIEPLTAGKENVASTPHSNK